MMCIFNLPEIDLRLEFTRELHIGDTDLRVSSREVIIKSVDYRRDHREKQELKAIVYVSYSCFGSL